MLLRVVVLFLLSISHSGCVLLKARPADNAGFLPQPELVMARTERAPFNGYWNRDPAAYDRLLSTNGRIFISPIDTSIVVAMYHAASGSEKTRQTRIEEAEELAKYFHERLKLSLMLQTRRTITVVDTPDPEVLQLKVALVEVVPTNPGINLVGTVAGFFVPGGGLIKYAGEGSIAMEGFTEYGLPEPVVYEQFKDREGQKASAFSVKDYQRYAHIRVVIDEWAEQIAELFTTPPEHMVKEPLPISINPF